MIYLDHNATTPLDDRVLEAMLPFLTTFYGNPSSLHRLGRIASSAIGTAREQLASLVGAASEQIVFTSGGTEANALALSTLSPNKGKLAISAIEHPSIMEPAHALASQGYHLSLLAVDRSSLVSQDAITQITAEQPDLVSIMLANNETGTIQPIARYTQQLKAQGIKVHTDAVQALGKIAVDFNSLGVDSMSLSSHKIYGPKGCGALIFDKKLAIHPLLKGGDQEQGLRAGTENVAAIVGFGKAAELAKAELIERQNRMNSLNTFLEKALRELPRLTLFSSPLECSPESETQYNRLPNTFLLGFDGIDGEMMLMQLDQKGIAVSSGSACASSSGAPSPVLLAMGVAPDQAKTVIRISLGKNTTEAELTTLINQLKPILGEG